MRKMTRYLGKMGLAIAALGLAVGVGLPQDASASLILRLTQGTSVVTIVDQGAGDSDAAAGIISFSGPVGVYDQSVTFWSKPAFGDSSLARMDLKLFNRSESAGTIQIEMTDTDFTVPAGLLHTSAGIGGTTVGTLDYTTWLDNANDEFGHATGLLFVGPFGPGDFSNITFGPDVGSVAPYSLTQEVTITHTSAGETRLDTGFFAAAVPEPSTLFLLGSGLVGLVGFGRKRRKK